MITRNGLLFAAVASSIAMCVPQPAPAGVAGMFDRLVKPVQPRTHVLLVDSSGSIEPEDRQIYRQSVKAMADRIAPGDRILIAKVGDATRAKFRPVLDLVVPREAARLSQEEALARSQERVRRTAFKLIATEDRQRSTQLMETIAAASQSFAKRRAPGDRILILTDAVEEGALVNLDRRPMDVRQIDAALAAARADGLLPNLSGVELVFVGTGGRHYASVAQFWRRYAAATGAQLGQYGRLALAAAP